MVSDIYCPSGNGIIGHTHPESIITKPGIQLTCIMTDSTHDNLDSLLGKLIIDKGLATTDEVRSCLDKYRHAREDYKDSNQSFSELLVVEGVVTKRQVERLRPEIEEQRAGQQIPGYQILAPLGAGAMARVYKARQLSLDRLVAIKVLPLKFTGNPQFVERFYAEGRAAAKLNHNNIVGALDVGKAGDFHYFVMELVDGQSVYEQIIEKGYYTEEEALKIAIQIADALVHAHDAGLIHRDVKPKNIMITKEGVAKLADMGLARAISDREAAEAEQGKAYGTPYYISPEQIRGERDVDFRADIYGLGATLYHMVTGRVPFDGPNPSAVMHKHLKAELVPPDHINSKLSRGICEIIEMAMAKDRNQRYATTADMLEDLSAVVKGEPPIQARQKIDWDPILPPDAEYTPPPISEPDPLFAQPLFWIAVTGWVLLLASVLIFSAQYP